MPAFKQLDMINMLNNPGITALLALSYIFPLGKLQFSDKDVEAVQYIATELVLELLKATKGIDPLDLVHALHSKAELQAIASSNSASQVKAAIAHYICKASKSPTWETSDAKYYITVTHEKILDFYL